MNLRTAYITFITLSVMVMLPGESKSQGFDFVSAEQGILVYNPVQEYGAGVTMYDFDGDGWDDLTFCMSQDSLKLFRNNEGSYEPYPSPLYVVGESKHATWVDFDNDGDQDLFLTRYNGPNTLLRNDGDMSFTDISDASGIDPVTTATTYGAAWGDYDKDGFLDVYICNYNWLDGVTNWLMHNNGDGTFTETGLNLGVDNSSLPSFQPTWIDYNNDGWPDLYVINDKVPTNALYMNNGDGTFTDVSMAAGADYSIEAMCNAVSDFNHDGFLDIYMTNNSSGNKLMRNAGDGTFDEWASIADVEVFMLSWGATWIDYDNNTWDDLYVATDFALFANQNWFFESNGDETFTSNLNLGFTTDGGPAYSNSKGDIDNDGFYDFAVSSIDPFPAKVWQNQGIGGNSLKVTLQGTVSNRDAIGSWVRYYMNGDEYVLYTLCGEGYLGQNSQHKILGMADNEMIDSLQIEWPSGLIENYFDLAAGQSFTFIEGENSSVSLLQSGPALVCAQDTTVLSVNGDYETFEWSTGEDTSTITPQESGNYWVTVTTGFGFSIQSDTLTIVIADTIEYSIDGNHPDCYGEMTGSIALNISGDVLADSILFDFGGEGALQSDLGAGIYPFTILDDQGCYYLDSYEIIQPDSIGVLLDVFHVSCFGFNDGAVDVEIEGGTEPYTIEWSVESPDSLTAGTYEVQVTDSLGCVSLQAFTVDQPEALDFDLTTTDAPEGGTGTAEIEISGGTEPYDILWSNGTSDLIVDLDPGDHSVWVVDTNGCSVFEEFVIEVMIGINEVDGDALNLFPNPCQDHFFLETDSEAFISVFDRSGRMVMIDRIQAGRNEISVVSLDPGLYIVLMNRGGILSYTRLIRLNE
jgi:hypothetical protein